MFIVHRFHSRRNWFLNRGKSENVTVAMIGNFERWKFLDIPLRIFLFHAKRVTKILINAKRKIKDRSIPWQQNNSFSGDDIFRTDHLYKFQFSSLKIRFSIQQISNFYYFTYLSFFCSNIRTRILIIQIYLLVSNLELINFIRQFRKCFQTWNLKPQTRITLFSFQFFPESPHVRLIHFYIHASFFSREKNRKRKHNVRIEDR